jgi:hypothetical protein
MKTTFFVTCAVTAMCVAWSAPARAACNTPGWQTCQSWCKEWRGGSETCLYTDPKSCMKNYGSLNACVRSGPPGSVGTVRPTADGYFRGCDNQLHKIPYSPARTFDQCMKNGPSLNCSKEQTHSYCRQRFPA